VRKYKARSNRSDPRSQRVLPVDLSLDIDPERVRQYAGAFRAWHWGIPPQRVIDWNDPDMPRALIECGRLVRLHLRAPGSSLNPRLGRDTMVEFSRSVSKDSHIAYDPNHPFDRLYLLIAPRARAVIRQRFWDENNARPLNLNLLAAAIGGKHAKRADYPRLMVKPVGVLTAVVYRTWKKGDSDEQGGSYYIHRLGEVSGVFPALAADQSGRLWLAGGNCTSPTPGISD